MRKQIRRSANAVTAQLISERFVFTTRVEQFLFYLNPKFQVSIFRDCTGLFVSDLVGNPEDQFSRVVAHFIYAFQKHFTDRKGGILQHRYRGSGICRYK